MVNQSLRLTPLILLDLFQKVNITLINQVLKNNAGKKYLMLVQVESKILSITGLATSAALNVDESNIPNISNLITKKIEYDAKISNTETKYLIVTNLHVK